nr:MULTISPECIES: hypothetical protein [Myxococcaceae]
MELKLEYEPSCAEGTARYLVEAFLFLPASLNVDEETYPRADFYAGIHNYVRFKTPVMSLQELLSEPQSPLLHLEASLAPGVGTARGEPELVYHAKLLSCVVRGALRRFAQGVEQGCAANAVPDASALEARVEGARTAMAQVLERYRTWARLAQTPVLQEKTRASLRLVDEYLSLSVEQCFRRAVADMEGLPRSGGYLAARKGLMADVLQEEAYRKQHGLKSVLVPGGDNEEYMHRLGFLKKFCMNILFLSARRKQKRQGVEEVLFAFAAGLAMTFATAVAFWAQARFSQVSLNFFLIVVVGYMMKDRIKEGLRRIFSQAARTHLYDRTMQIVDPVTQRHLGTCEERVDYGRAARVPADVQALRRRDDFATVSQGELTETVIRYAKKIVLQAELLPRTLHGRAGVTDIIRLSVERFLRDMDEPEYALEYVDMEDFSVGHVRGAKRYQVDLVLRCTVSGPRESGTPRVSLSLVRLVLDRNGIARLQRLTPEPPAQGEPQRSAA